MFSFDRFRFFSSLVFFIFNITSVVSHRIVLLCFAVLQVCGCITLTLYFFLFCLLCLDVFSMVFCFTASLVPNELDQHPTQSPRSRPLPQYFTISFYHFCSIHNRFPPVVFSHRAIIDLEVSSSCAPPATALDFS